MNENIGLENIDITNEELQRFSKAFKNEEFKKLFADYCKEISDPANKRLYESELTQLEAERGIDLTFINPEPGYVIKTSLNGKEKVFINVAKCDKVGRPTSTCGRDASGHKGLQWSLPYTQSPLRKDIDNKGTVCAVYDVVFHPDALHLAEKNPKFRQLVTDTACDAVQTAFGVQLDLVNRKFPKIAFKGTARATIIRKKSENPPADIEPSPIDKIYPPLKKEQQIPNTSKTEKLQTPDKCEQYKVPTYKIVHRRNVEYHEMTSELDSKMNLTVPKELIVTVDLPLLRSSAEVTLDVTPRKLYLVSESPAKYKLDVVLPYSVDELIGSAEFDKAKRRLIITLPVVHKQLGLVNLCHSDSGVEIDEKVSSDNSDTELKCDNGLNKEKMSSDVQGGTNGSIAFISENKELSKKHPESADIDSMPADPLDDVFLSKTQRNAQTFLDPSLSYEFPTYAFNTLKNTAAFTLHVKNVDPSSIVVENKTLSFHIKFTSIGVGFYPQHFAFCVRFPEECGRIIEAQPDAWDNNLILQIELEKGTDSHYETGLDLTNLTMHHCESSVVCKSTKNALAAELDASIIVDVNSIDENEVNIEITSPKKSGATDDTKAKTKKKNKNKKRRSYSESHCEDLKAEYEATIATQTIPEDHQSDFKLTSKTNSIDIHKSPAKERSFSESSNDDQVVPTKGIKGILKRRSSFNRSISESSVDDHFYSCSIDLGVGSIPEEEAEPMSESCKKTVRFDNNIRKQLYKIRSTILGQRKPQANKRKKKKRTTERRYSEGEASDYDTKPTEAVTKAAPRNDQVVQKRDSGVDLSDDTCSKPSLSSSITNNTKTANRTQQKIASTDPKHCDLEFKNDMIFDIEM